MRGAVPPDTCYTLTSSLAHAIRCMSLGAPTIYEQLFELHKSESNIGAKVEMIIGGGRN
jgi:hypothetical protein